MALIAKILLLDRKLSALRVLRKICSTTHSNCSQDAQKKVFRKSLEDQGEWYSSFRLFAPERKIRSSIIKFIQTPVDLRPKTLERWLQRKKKEMEIFEQRFIKERHEALGKDLASAHFVLRRGGKIRFYNEQKWYSNVNEIPSTYRSDVFLEAIDLSNTNIYYEGLYNIFSLRYLKWLRLNSCVHIDDWCIDYISGEFRSSLEYLDLSNCTNVTERGIATLFRVPQLKLLNLNNVPSSAELELTCLLLEDICKSLEIEGITYVKA